jgi:hypothetical protein
MREELAYRGVVRFDDDDDSGGCGVGGETLESSNMSELMKTEKFIVFTCTAGVSALLEAGPVPPVESLLS